MLARLKIAVVGAGAVVRKYHVAAIDGVPEVVRTLVVDMDGQRAREFAARYAFPHASSDLEDLSRLGVDVAIVAVPNWQHASIASDLLAKGIHVLCEKPMARTVAECRQMIDAARKGRAQLCIGHNRRFRQHIALAKRLLDKGLIGRVTNVNAAEGSQSDWPRSPAYFDVEQSGGGALLDVGIHSIDLIRWLVGDFTDIRYHADQPSNRVESECELNFELMGGSTGRLTVSRKRELSQSLAIHGTEGLVELGLWEPTLSVKTAKGKPFRHFDRLSLAVGRRAPNDSSFVDQLRNLVAAIHGEGTVLVDGREGLAAVEVVTRAYGRNAVGSANAAANVDSVGGPTSRVSSAVCL